MSENELQPLGARVTLRPAATPSKVGSLWVPPEAQESTYGVCQAEVVAVGPDVRDARIQPGLRVLTRRFGGFDHQDGSWTVYEHDVLAVVDEDAL